MGCELLRISFLFGVFRCGNKPPVLPGDNKKGEATIERAS